jgi:hypothetical protein
MTACDRTLAVAKRVFMASTDEKVMTERARADERVRAIVEELDRPTLALLYKTLHDALGFRIETVDIAIGKLHR